MSADATALHRHEDSSPTFYGSQKARSPQRLTKSADGSKANRWWGKTFRYSWTEWIENMELSKRSKSRLRGCRLVAANPAPNKKRLAQRSQRPHRPHLTGHRKIPMFLWGAFSTPELNAGEDGLEAGYLLHPPLNPIFCREQPERTPDAFARPPRRA